MRGSITQRSKGSWTIRFDAGRDPLGKRSQQRLTIHGTKKDAERKLADVLHTLDTGGYIKPQRLTFGQFLERWLQDYVATNTAPSTALSYNMVCHCHIIPELGTVLLTELRPGHLQHYYAKLLVQGRSDGKGGLSARTVLRHHRVLSEALNHAVK